MEVGSGKTFEFVKLFWWGKGVVVKVFIYFFRFLSEKMKQGRTVLGRTVRISLVDLTIFDLIRYVWKTGIRRIRCVLIHIKKRLDDDLSLTFHNQI